MFVKHSLTVIFSTNIMELDFLEKNYWYLTCRVFQIREGSRVNNPTKNASWPDRWHISVKFNIMRKISAWSCWPLRCLHDLRLKELTGTLHVDCSAHVIISAETYTKLMVRPLLWSVFDQTLFGHPMLSVTNMMLNQNAGSFS